MMRLIIGWMLLLGSFAAFAQQEKWKQWEVEGDTLLNRENFTGALKLYTKVIDDSKLKDQSVLGCLYKRAVCYYSLGEFDKSLKDLDQFITVYPGVFNSYLLRAFIYKELGDADKQLLNLEEAVNMRPSSPELLKWRAMLYLDKNEFRKAITDIRTAQLFQDDAETETYLGFAFFNLDRQDSALMALNKAIELDASYLPAYFYAGSFCLQSGEYDLALQYLNLALRLEPRNPTALFYKGVALVEKKKIDEGCSCLNKAFYLGADEAADYLKEYCYNVDN